ncbi:MAG: hypothetical protein Ctma_0528 [Catillopecten margaritatus gill symbiont]|uniref:Sulfur globule protein CV1 n=1 Tax=Catillopecten margaritatus gill symbiont TaxID=3083288 RepID=A0AAU6PFR6_9GAMM
MKKILAIAILAFTMSANAFWNNNNMPWNGNNMPWENGVSNYNGYGYNQNGQNGYQQDNGFFAYNPYDYWDPRWYAEEMSNMFDEFDNNGWNNNGNNYRRGYGYNPHNTQILSRPTQVK